MKSLFTGVAALALAGTAQAATTVADLAKPPADAEQITIMSTAGRHGVSYRWTTPDGVRHARESMDLRGQVFETGQRHQAGRPTGWSARVHRARRSRPRAIRPRPSRSMAGAGLEEPGGRRLGARDVRPAEYVAFGGPMEPERGDRRGALARSGPVPRPAARRPGALPKVLRRWTSGRATNRRTISLYVVTGLFNTPGPGLGGRQGPVLRRWTRGSPGSAPATRPTSRGIDKAQDDGHGRPLAGARAPARQGAGRADRLRPRARLRGRRPLRRGSHGGRGRRQDRRRRALRERPGAGRRPGDRRLGQDAGARPVGLAPALRRRLPAGRSCSRSGSPRSAIRATTTH